MPVYYKQKNIPFTYTIVSKIIVEHYDAMKAESELQLAACRYEENTGNRVDGLLMANNTMSLLCDEYTAYLIKKVEV